MSKYTEEVARIEKIYNAEVEEARREFVGMELRRQLKSIRDYRDRLLTKAEWNTKWDVIHINHAGRRRVICSGVNIGEANEMFYRIENTEIVEHGEEA